MKVGIVLLYGLYSPERKDYQEYLDFIVEEIIREKFEKAVLCGGFTDPKRPKLSEASTVREYLTTKTDFDGFVLEDRSVNTNQNLEFAKQRLNLSSEDEIIVYCDLIRKAKVIWIALHFLLDVKPKVIYKALIDFAYQKDVYADFAFENLTVRGFDFPGKSKEETIGQSYATVLDVMSLYDREMEDMDIGRRKKDFGLEEKG